MKALLALDLDGTVIGPDLHVRPSVVDAVRRARNAGAVVAVVTGRMFAAARPFVDALELDGPVVCYQGAAIYEAPSGERVFHQPLANDVAFAVLRKARADGVHVQFYRDDLLYVEDENRYSALYARATNTHPVLVDDLETAFADAATTKLVLVLDAERAATYAAIVAEDCGERAYVTRSQPEYIEVLDPRVDKGVALRFLAQHLGIPDAATFAVGDSWNDAPLLRASAFGIAMGSAPPELRAVARAVVGDVDHEGVVEAIDRYVLPALADARAS